jgi:hypothetical protein
VFEGSVSWSRNTVWTLEKAEKRPMSEEVVVKVRGKEEEECSKAQ